MGIQDRRGHEIYLTEERWQHLCDEPPEMLDHERELFEVIRLGRRSQDSVRPHVYLYYLDCSGLPYGNTTVVVVVRFGYFPNGDENNFVLTAYQIRRRSALTR
jgi:hypothetical protein